MGISTPLPSCSTNRHKATLSVCCTWWGAERKRLAGSKAIVQCVSPQPQLRRCHGACTTPTMAAAAAARAPWDTACTAPHLEL